MTLHLTSRTAPLGNMESRRVPSVRLMDAARAQPRSTAQKGQSLRSRARPAIGALKVPATRASTLAQPAPTLPLRRARHKATARSAWRVSTARQAQQLVTRCARLGIGALPAQVLGTSSRVRLGRTVARPRDCLHRRSAKRVSLARTARKAQLTRPLAPWEHTTHPAAPASSATASHALRATPVR